MSNDWIGKTRKEICLEFNLSVGEVDDGLDGEELAYIKNMIVYVKIVLMMNLKTNSKK